MTPPKVSSKLGFRIQRISTILTPPITAGICLLAGLQLFYVAFFTIAVAFPASLVNRRLHVYAEAAMAEKKQDLSVELLEGWTNVVACNTRNGTQIIGFFKISQQPQRHFLQALNSTVANSNLAISLLKNANGTFLVIRFPGKSYRNRRRLICDAIEHLKTYTQSITQDISGLKLMPADLNEIRNLAGFLGLTLARRTNSLTADQSDDVKTESDLEGRSFQGNLYHYSPIASLRPNPPIIESLISQKEILSSSMDNSLQFDHFTSEMRPTSETKDNCSLSLPIKNASDSEEEHFFYVEDIQISDPIVYPKSDAKTQSGPLSSSTRHHSASDNVIVVAKLRELHRRISQTIQGLKGSENEAGLSHTDKRIAGRLVVKDLIKILETAEELNESPYDVKNTIAELRRYIVEQLGMSADAYMDPEVLWKRIPEGTKIIAILLEKLDEPLTKDRDHYQQDRKTPQAA
ncbi:MAG: hypothetical protein ACFFB3_10390 [Candidatus Hodarchaeota archaeon]